MTPWLDWLMTPLSGAAVHEIAAPLAWHGRLMVLAWGLALPLAVLLARFFKVTPRQRWPQELDNRFWWHAHRGLALGVALASLVALGAVLLGSESSARTSAARLHAALGWTVLVGVAVQLVGAYLRGSKGGPTDPRRGPDGQALDLRGDHYDMTPLRYRFERLHKAAGYAALLLALAAMLSGLWLADAPRWMPLGLLLAWTGFALAFARWQRQGRCLDTYQAIWGPGLEHPGNHLPVTGVGVRRVRLPSAASVNAPGPAGLPAARNEP